MLNIYIHYTLDRMMKESAINGRHIFSYKIPYVIYVNCA